MLSMMSYGLENPRGGIFHCLNDILKIPTLTWKKYYANLDDAIPWIVW